MAGNKEGNRKVREALIRKLGSEALYLAHMKSIGSKGGEKGGPGKGFSSEKLGKDGLTGKERAKQSRWAKKDQV